MRLFWLQWKATFDFSQKLISKFIASLDNSKTYSCLPVTSSMGPVIE